MPAGANRKCVGENGAATALACGCSRHLCPAGEPASVHPLTAMHWLPDIINWPPCLQRWRLMSGSTCVQGTSKRVGPSYGVPEMMQFS